MRPRKKDAKKNEWTMMPFNTTIKQTKTSGFGACQQHNNQQQKHFSWLEHFILQINNIDTVKLLLKDVGKVEIV